MSPSVCSLSIHVKEDSKCYPTQILSLTILDLQLNTALAGAIMLGALKKSHFLHYLS
jgi:hypothetical protein